jgi:hypothetical protein
MNSKNLAIQVSKHPLVKKLLEGKVASSSLIARLIVEEVEKNQIEDALSRLEGIPKAIKDFLLNRFSGIYSQEQNLENLLLASLYLYEKGTELLATKRPLIAKDFLDMQGDAPRKAIEAFKKLVPSTREMNWQDVQDALPLPGSLQNDEGGQIATGLNAAFNVESQPAPSNKEREKEAKQVVTTALKIIRQKPDLKPENEDENTELISKVAQELKIDLDQEQQEAAEEYLITSLEEPTEEPSIEPAEEPEVKPEPEEETKKLELDDETKREFDSAYKEFVQEFYNKPYKKDQALVIKNLLDVLSKIKTEEDIELEAAAQRQPQELKEANEQVEADKKELRNIKLSLQAFLANVKKSKGLLKAFVEAANEGRMITSSYKEKFTDTLSELQKDVRDLVAYMLQLIGNENLQEARTKEQIMEEWKEIEALYDGAVETLGSLNSIIIGGEEGVVNDLFSDAFANLLKLGTHFPSVNPFGKSKTKDDYQSFQTNYESAIDNVKNSLQSVLVLIKKGEQNGPVLRRALKGLKEFSGQIQTIFDVKSLFKDQQIEPDEEAAQEETAKVTASPEEIEEIAQAVVESEEYNTALSEDEISTIISAKTPEKFSDEPSITKQVSTAVSEMTAFTVASNIISNDEITTSEEVETEIEKKAPQDKKDDNGFFDKVISAIKNFIKNPSSRPEGAERAEELKTALEDVDFPSPEEGWDPEEEFDEETIRTNVLFLDGPKTASTYFKQYYEPKEGETPYASVSDIMDDVFEFYNEEIGSENISENMANIKQNLTDQEESALSKALDRLAEQSGNVALQKFLGFIGQTSAAPISTSRSGMQFSYREKNNAWAIFVEVLKAISRKLITVEASSKINLAEEFGLSKEEVMEIRKFKDYLYGIQEALKMSAGNLKKYKEYIESLGKNRREIFQKAWKKIGDSDKIKKAKFEKYLGWNKNKETTEEEEIQEQIAKKIKPLIREMLNKGK